jgi:O-antigen ligase
MAYRVLFASGFILFILNLESAFGAGSTNFVTKGLLLAAGITFVSTRQALFPVILAGTLMIAVTVASAIFTRNQSFSWDLYLRSINQFIVPMLLLGAIPTRRDRNFVLRFLSWAPLLSVVIGLVYDLTGRGLLFAADNQNGVMRLRGSLIASFLAGLALTGMFAAMQYARHVNSRYIMVAAVNLLIIILTAARMAMALGCVLFLLSVLLSRRHSIGFRVTIASATTGFLAMFLLLFGDALLARFSSQSMSGRDVMWDFLLAMIAEFYDFGVGFGHQQTIISHDVFVVINSFHAHNDFLRIAVELGVVPALAFFALWLSALLYIWHHPRCDHDMMFVIGAGAFFVLAFTDNAISTSTHFPLLIVSALSALRPRSNLYLPVSKRHRSMCRPLRQKALLAWNARVRPLRPQTQLGSSSIS